MNGGARQGRASTIYRFHRRYGAALAAWADIEHVLAHWFIYACGADRSLAPTMRTVFYSTNSFKGSARMLRAAFRSQRRDASISQFFRAALNLTEGDYYAFRNKLAHRLTVYREDERRAIVLRGEDPFATGGEVTERDLVVARCNFTRLRRIWFNSLPGLTVKRPLTPEKALEHIARLPRDPCGNRLGRSEKGSRSRPHTRPASGE